MIRADPNRGMFCLDWDKEDLLIYGNERKSEYQRIEILMTPCNYLHTELGFEGDSISDECISDLDEQIKYLGPIHVVLYHTEEIFIQNQYEENAIRRQSVIWNQQVDETTPNWISTLFLEELA